MPVTVVDRLQSIEIHQQDAEGTPGAAGALYLGFEGVQQGAVIAKSGEAIPHSHPVLTLHTRHLRDDDLLLSTYLHEQSHRYFGDRSADTAAAIGALETLFPGLPVGYPDGGDSTRSSYEHLLVIAFERAGLVALLGELRAHQILEFWANDHYRALYRLILDPARRVRVLEVMTKHHLSPPSVSL